MDCTTAIVKKLFFFWGGGIHVKGQSANQWQLMFCQQKRKFKNKLIKKGYNE
jgi:hypothetical protein